MPELEALLQSTHPQLACTVIEAVGPAAAHCVPHLKRVERNALEGPPTPDSAGLALTVARTRFAVTGDETALLSTVDEVLTLTAPLREGAGTELKNSRPASATEASARWHVATLASALARCLSPLGPRAGTGRTTWLEQWLRANQRLWRSHEAIPVARAHWKVTGDSHLALQVFQSVLDAPPGAAYSQIELAALRNVAEMGPEAQALAPLLHACLDRDERISDNGGWRGIALDDEAQQLATAALSASPQP
ncbi:hypothetical protein [Actinomadura oligospora]|uniref:hypothetical protein n=1 Tax=Actinomadura oligospora TaxID=111804 RepID=UPI00047D680D|nr:hypothetical protein [Actinomadura oligospora]